jgi:hypothetical protein
LIGSAAKAGGLVRVNNPINVIVTQVYCICNDY